MWANRMGWEVPALHVRVCLWLEYCGVLALLMLPRGHAKSTILEIYNAWRYYLSSSYRILHQSESDGTALKTSRGTQNVLRHHPLTRGMLPDGQGTVEQWWVNGAFDIDPRNASMYAKGILSNVTSSRADEIQNDDIEVPRNIGTPEAREKLRYRLGEQVHIAVPGARRLFVGTPHTHDSIYEDIRRLGADALVIRMFEHEHRIECADKTRYALPFIPEFVFSGIGEGALMLRAGIHYRMEGKTMVLTRADNSLIDCYAGAAWPERFHGEELEKRRRETRTLNEWDSQYQLHAKPVTDIRLDPERIIPYDLMPRVTFANNTTGMWLGTQQIVGASARWDPSSGKLNSDVSAFAALLQDAAGTRYLHRVCALTGEVAEFAPDGKKIVGGQVWQLCDEIEALSLPRITVENNGIGQFAPAILRAALKQRNLRCAVVEATSTGNKNKRMLEAWEPLLMSRGQIWAHVDVLTGPLWNQMRDWNPSSSSQPDDYIDVSAAAIADTPERFKAVAAKGGIPHAAGNHDWRPEAGTFDAVFER